MPALMNRIVVLLLTLVTVVTAVGCKTDIDDVRKWENAKGRKEKMKEFILAENTLEVKVEAVMVLVRKGEGSNLMPILKELPDAERGKITEEAVAQLEKMMEGDDQAAQLRAKDGAYYLAQTGPSDELRARLRALLIKWLDGDNFWRPLETVGDADRTKILEETGAMGLPVIMNVLNDRFEKLATAQTDERRNKLQQDIMGIVDLASGLNLAETDEAIAKLFAEQIDKSYPNLYEAHAIPYTTNKSEVLKEPAKRILLDPDYKTEGLNILRDIIINEYYTEVQTKEGISVCGKVLREDRSGFNRWMCARTLLKVALEGGVDHVFLGLPDDPEAVKMPADHPLASQFNLQEYFVEESKAFCRSIGVYLDNKIPLDKFRNYLKSTRTVEKLVALICLSYYGTDADVATMRTLETDVTDISAWSYGELNTLGKFAVFFADAHNESAAAAKAQ